MSAQSNQIVIDAIADIGTRYYWAPFMNAAALYSWATGDIPIHTVGANADNPICCFEYPMLLAARRGYLDQQGVRNIIGKLMDSGFNASSFATAWSKVWNDWPSFAFSKTYWRPRRGDLVFYSAAVGGDTNHVVLSLGPNAAGTVEVISFGEGLQNAAPALVTRTTVNALRQKGHTAVKFVSPPWY